MARPRIHDDDTADRVVDVAGALLRQEGPGAVTMRRLAEAADTSPSALYRLFGSKHEVVRAMFRAGFANLAAHQAEVDTPDPVDRIRAHARAYRAAARARPHLYDVMFACPIPEFTPDDDDRALSMGTLGVLRDTVTDAIDAGRLVGDPDDVTLGLWGLVHGLATLELAGALDEHTDAEVVWDTMLEATLRGLAGDPA